MANIVKLQDKHFVLIDGKLTRVLIDCFDGKYDFLSNFAPAKISFEGITYPTVEHAFQAAKTLDNAERIKIANAPTPSKAKWLGRRVHLRPDWEQIKDDVMLTCIRKKFKNPVLQEKLLATGDAELVEGTTWHDNYWGNCTCEKCKDIQGRNQLGKILMQVRKEIADMKKNKIKENKKILVVVDMQNDFVSGALGSKEAKIIVDAVAEKVAEYEKAGDLILFTKDTHGEDYMNTQEGAKLPVPHCIKGTEGWALIPELAQYDIEGSENIIEKPTFGSTQLIARLSNIALITPKSQTLTIEFIGLCTDICVVSNVLLAKAHLLDAVIMVDASCCAGVSVDKHLAALETMKSCQVNVIGEA